MSKLKLFLILASALLISCANPNDPGDDGTGGGNGGGGTGGGSQLTQNPSWFLTAEQQAQDFYIETKPFEPTSANKYRIPAVVVANNGNIIVFADDRYSHGSDIGFGGGAIDIVYKISKDGGKTWGDKKIILPLSQAGANENNKGDPVVFKCKNGDLVVLAIAGGAWFSAPRVPSVLVMSKSTDNGETWSAWKKVGEESLWKAGPFADKAQPTFIRKAFTASGKGLTLNSGRLMAAMLAGVNNGSGGHAGQAALCIYSDDNGETWKPGGYVNTVNASSANNGQINEPKIIAELNDGTIVMSIRNANGYNNSQAPRLYSLSKDGGMTWKSVEGVEKQASGWANMHDADVNADGVRWTSTKLGHDKDRIVHILANGPRRRVGLGLYLSTDEAKTFKEVKKILPDSDAACYATTELLPDGTIVTVSEEKPANNGYTLVFRRYNLKLLTGEVYNAEWYKDWYLTAK